MSSFDIVSGGVNARVIFSFFLSGNKKLEKSKSQMIFHCKSYDATEFTKRKPVNKVKGLKQRCKQRKSKMVRALLVLRFGVSG
jgi:hypothetical protein